MNSDDEAYNNFIVTSDDEESAKENVSVKQPKTSQMQFDLIISFAKENDEHTMPKEIIDRKWEELATELNNIGPPIRGSWEWRRVWSVYKYNRKRKQASTQSSDKRRSHQGAPLSFRPPIDQVPFDVIPLDNTQPPITVQILKKLDEIFNVVKESNELLKKLASSTPQ